MNNFEISVIVPVYGVEKYIERCSHSIFTQTMTEGVEFIFVNDCTKDRSIELLSACIDRHPHLRPQITVINHHHNRGLAAARLTGLNAARGKYILNLDSDDFFEPDMLEVMYHAAVTTNADVVVSDFFWALKKGDVYQKCHLYPDKETMLKSIIAPWKYADKSIFQSLWNKLIKRSIYTDHNIKPVEGINHGEDLIVSVQILFHANVITKVNRAFMHYNKQNPGAYSQDKTSTNIRQRLMATDFAADFLARNACNFEEEFNRRRFREKMIAVTNCDLENLDEFLSMYPGLDYSKNKHLIAPYWRLPYKFALQGNKAMFLFLRNILLPIRKAYRLIYAR